MEFLVVSIAALVTSALTLFSGFGLGTFLMPVVALFFPLDVAIAITAVVHLANNLFKLALLGRQAHRQVLLYFGVPAIIAAFPGAFLLTWLSDIPPLFDYVIFGRQLQVSPIKLIIGVLILCFVAIELFPRLASLSLDRKYLPVGGVLSGFFGGLSGHQGAFRSMFLLKAGLTKEEFVATGIVVAVMVDVSRMGIYGWDILSRPRAVDWTLVITASLAAFAGAYLGARLLRKVTINAIRVSVAVLLVIISLGLISGAL